MPYARTVRYASPIVAWHDLALLEAAPSWSDSYRVESPRMIVPRSLWLEADRGGMRTVCDSLTPLRLAPDVPYRMRQPFKGQQSVVLIFPSASCPPGGESASRRGRDLRAHWALASCRAALEVGVADRLAFEEQLVDL